MKLLKAGGSLYAELYKIQFSVDEEAEKQTVGLS